MSEEGANEEFEIYLNGPNIAHCDSVVKEALDNYWSWRKGGAWHFYKVSVVKRLKTYKYNSKVLDKLKNTASHLPYIEPYRVFHGKCQKVFFYISNWKK